MLSHGVRLVALAVLVAACRSSAAVGPAPLVPHPTGITSPTGSGPTPTGILVYGDSAGGQLSTRWRDLATGSGGDLTPQVGADWQTASKLRRQSAITRTAAGVSITPTAPVWTSAPCPDKHTQQAHHCYSHRGTAAPFVVPIEFGRARDIPIDDDRLLVRGYQPGHHEITAWLLDARAGTTTMVAKPDTDPVATRDGKLIAWISPHAPAHVTVRDLATPDAPERQIPLPDHGDVACDSFPPAPELLVCTSRAHELLAIDLEASTVTVLATDVYGLMTMSPDGRWIAFSRGHAAQPDADSAGDVERLMVVSRAGGDPIPVTDAERHDQLPIAWIP